jgi:hypothetical protein
MRSPIYKNQNSGSGQPFEVMGYAADADTYCPDCAEEKYPDGIDNEGNEVGAIFADSEWDRAAYCAACGEYIIGEDQEERG